MFSYNYATTNLASALTSSEKSPAVTKVYAPFGNQSEVVVSPPTHFSFYFP